MQRLLPTWTIWWWSNWTRRHVWGLGDALWQICYCSTHACKAQKRDDWQNCNCVQLHTDTWSLPGSLPEQTGETIQQLCTSCHWFWRPAQPWANLLRRQQCYRHDKFCDSFRHACSTHVWDWTAVQACQSVRSLLSPSMTLSCTSLSSYSAQRLVDADWISLVAIALCSLTQTGILQMTSRWTVLRQNCSQSMS